MINREKNVSKEKGSIVLLVSLVILPVLLFFLTLSLDLSRYFSLLQSSQDALDEATQHAYRFLPDTAAAESAVKSILRERYALAGKILFEETNSQLRINYSGALNLSFPSFFGISSSINYNVASTASGVALNTAMLVDVSAYMSASNEASLWPDNLPSLSYFKEIASRQGKGESFADLLGQQCFNSAIFAEKIAALNIADYLLSFKKNSLALAFFPGTVQPVDIVQTGKSGSIIAENISKEYFKIANSELISNNDCLSALEEEVILSTYKMPKKHVFPNTEHPDNFDNRFTDPDTFSFREEHLSEFNIADAIWSRGVRKSLPDIGNTLESLSLMLSSTGINNTSQINNPLRVGNKKLGIIMMGNMPGIGTSYYPDSFVSEVIKVRLRELNNLLSQAHSVSIYFIFFRHFGTNMNVIDVDQFRNFIEGIKNDPINPLNKLNIRIIFRDQNQALEDDIMSVIATTNTGTVIQR